MLFSALSSIFFAMELVLVFPHLSAYIYMHCECLYLWLITLKSSELYFAHVHLLIPLTGTWKLLNLSSLSIWVLVTCLHLTYFNLAYILFINSSSVAYYICNMLFKFLSNAYTQKSSYMSRSHSQRRLSPLDDEGSAPIESLQTFQSQLSFHYKNGIKQNYKWQVLQRQWSFLSST